MPYVLAIAFSPYATAFFPFSSSLFPFSLPGNKHKILAGQEMAVLYCMCYYLFREIHMLLSLQMIDTGFSGRLTCCQDTHSRCVNMDRESLHIRLTRQSGGNLTGSHTSSLETGKVHTDACSKI